LVVRPVRLAGVFGGHPFRRLYPNGDEVEYTSIVFECEVTGGRLEALDGESLELRYFTPEAAPPLTAPYPRDLLTAPGGGGRFQSSPAE
jgi:hypothetical protein